MNAPIDVTNIRIETERLILRPWQESDLDDFYEYASVDGVGQMAGWTPHKSKEESKVILGFFLEGKNTFAIELKESGRVIGSLGIEEPESAPETGAGRELGYVLSKDYWGRELMPEAVHAVVDYCFRVLNYDYLTCSHFDWNSQSRRVIEKCGFHYFSRSKSETRYETIETSINYIQFNPNK